MKIAISAHAADPDLEFSARFARCECFLVVDPAGEDWQEVENPARDAQGGAGTQVVQFLAKRGVEAVISGRYGPNAYQALQAAGMAAYLASAGSPQELLADFQAKRLKTASGPNSQGAHGAQGRGAGGRGSGKRGRGGRGRGGRGQGGQW